MTESMRRLRLSESHGGLVETPPEPTEGAPQSEIDHELMQQAAEKLGYRGPAEREASRVPQAYPLSAALHKMGCQIFTDRSVEGYKTREAAARNERARSFE